MKMTRSEILKKSSPSSSHREESWVNGNLIIGTIIIRPGQAHLQPATDSLNDTVYSCVTASVSRL